MKFQPLKGILGPSDTVKSFLEFHELHDKTFAILEDPPLRLLLSQTVWFQEYAFKFLGKNI